VQVRKKDRKKEWLTGRISEVTRNSNHGDWIEVWFNDVHTILNAEWQELSSNAHTYFIGYDEIKPILRPLIDMTEEEAKELGTMLLIPNGSKYSRAHKNNQDQWVVRYGNVAGEFWIITGEIFNQHQTIYLLSKHFDPFGLIEAGLAIDKTKLNSDNNEVKSKNNEQ
jgi:hypothetical protein